MDLVIVGPGRAGGSLARASRAAGHRLVGTLSRSGSTESGPALSWDEPLPECDLAIVAVTDAAIGEVAELLAPVWNPETPVVHLSGFAPISELDPLAAAGASVGSFHPLQTLPDPERGATALRGAFVAVTALPALSETLGSLARSLGLEPFPLADEAKPLYHAAAAAAANYVVEAMAVAHDLLAAADVDWQVVEPLTRAVIDNVFAIGPSAALTGPIARGDLGTVAGQQAAADSVSDVLGDEFRLLSQATARRLGLDL